MRLAPASDTQARFKLGIQLVETRRDVEQGLDVIRQVVAQRPDYSLYPFGLGEALAFVGRPREALPHLERAVIQAPTILEYRFRAAMVHLQAGEVGAARGHLDFIARANPRYPGLEAARDRLARVP